MIPVVQTAADRKLGQPAVCEKFFFVVGKIPKTGKPFLIIDYTYIPLSKAAELVF